MAAGDQILSRLTRTLKSTFQIGVVILKDVAGVLQFRNAGDTAFTDVGVNKLRVQGGNATHAVILNAPGGLVASPTYVLPGTDGSTGQFIQTNGSGTWSFASVIANAVTIHDDAFTEATSSPVAMFTTAADAEILEVTIKVTVAAAAGSPTLEVGNVSDPDAYMTTADVDLLTVGTYTIYPAVDVGASPVGVLLTITPAGQTFTGTILVKYANAS